MKLHECWQVMLLFGMVSLGCSSPAPPGGMRVKTYPVTGIVHVDGTPAEGVTIRFVPQEEGMKYSLTTLTEPAGKFTTTTYVTGDGLPVGRYKLTFVMEESKLELMSRDVTDKLKGAYKDAANSKFEVTVKDAKVDMGVIELSSGGSTGS